MCERSFTVERSGVGGARSVVLGVPSVEVPAKTILIVDDDPDIRRIAALSLEHVGGFRVLQASSAAQALETAEGERPDLVLLDVSMPGMGGPGTLEALRARESTRDVPVVFFTAGASKEEVEALRALGAVGVIAKPFEVRSLPARVRDLLAWGADRS